jgi:hypothetical protein
MSRSASISQSLLTFAECIGNGFALPPLVVGEASSARVTAANTVSNSSTHRRILVAGELAGPAEGGGRPGLEVSAPSLCTGKNAIAFGLHNLGKALVGTSRDSSLSSLFGVSSGSGGLWLGVVLLCRGPWW